MSEHKITYIASIYDEQRVAPEKKQKVKAVKKPKRNEVESILKTNFFDGSKTTRQSSRRKNSIERVNPRNKLFCRCGGSVECMLTNKTNVAVTVKEYDYSNQPRVTVKEYDYSNQPRVYRYWNIVKKLTDDEAAATGIYGYAQSDTEFEPIVCPKCNHVYEKFNEVELLSGHSSTGQNISRVRTLVFENDKTLSLCCFATKLIVNHRSKKIFSKEIKHFISYNKEKNFFVRGGPLKKGSFLRKFGLRFIPNNLKEVMWEFTKIQEDRVSKDTASVEKSETDMLSSMEEFCYRLLLLINKNDADRISAMLSDVFVRELQNYYSLSDTITSGKLFSARHDFIFKYRLPTIMSVVIYPPIATMFITKGVDFTIGLLNSWIVPSTMVIKRERPTAPIKILESMIKLKLLEDSGKRRSMEKGYKKAKKLSELSGKSISPKRYYKYDDKIPDDIKNGDFRVECVKITKNIFKDLQDPAFADALLHASISNDKLPKNYFSLVEKYGLEACAEPFRQLSIEGRHKLNIDNIEHIIRLSKKFFDKTQLEFEYKYYSHTIYGKPRVPPLDIYSDTIRMMNLMGRDHSELTHTRDFDEVTELHNRLAKEYESVKNELLEASVKKSMSVYKYMNCEIDGVLFTLLDGVSELNNESAEMHHCVRTYAQSVADGDSVIFKIKDSVDGSRATMGTFVTKDKDDNKTVGFVQLKAMHNAKATHKIRRAAAKFCKKNNIKVDAGYFKGDLHNADKEHEEINKEEPIIIRHEIL